MPDVTDQANVHLSSCDSELDNFVQTFRLLRSPSGSARIGDIELFGDSIFVNGEVGGDHIVILEFENRYDIEKRITLALHDGRPDIAEKLAESRDRIGILVADVCGHQMTDALVAGMLHQSFLTGVLYELDSFGEVTTRLFENLNTRFNNSVSMRKYVTLTYGEVSRTGTFRFMLAGCPRPLIFSAEYDRCVTIAPDRLVSFFPLGMFPSEDDIDIARNLGALQYKPKYAVNEVNLMGPGDILLLVTDGFTEHEPRGVPFVPSVLEDTLRTTKSRSAREIFEAVRNAALQLGPPDDDMTLVVVKRTN